MQKVVGNFSVKTFEDSDVVLIEKHYNRINSAEIRLNDLEDVADLQYVLECVMNENSKRAAQRR